ncbi:amino acid ABC transporter permease [Parachitinimonas caeni]|uniref:Amino acid ABC transporter permease n=1 Tax=Parachitinimonas caeni TaxID=3031301 RepID=A0ABT7DY56_9NEIS|nr:amino acid ABC transporter permease [Parachitinimonas caeni]MDK2124993.1 amino acid ABC transporter permease [Parachitinimonas caeni]
MQLDWSSIPRASNALWEGFQFSISLTAFAALAGIILGTLLAMARLSSIKPLSMIASGYVNIFRSTPLVIVIYWFYVVLPFIIGRPIGAEHSAYVTFAIFEAAYFCEIMRAGIQSIPKGQVYAGSALGFTYGQNMRYIILPQAFRNVVPLLLTQTIILFQDTSLVYVLGATDLFGAADKIAHRDNTLLEMYVTVAVIYFVISFFLSRLVKHLHSKIAIIR